MNNDQPRWTEIDHLPEWDEEFYHVYTAKKFGKWVMLKTLRPEYKDSPEMQAMLEKEFDIRYNLCHPNIVMINDFEEVPGIGRCIITDDVYGDSLRKLLKEGKVTEAHIEKLSHNLVDALEYIQNNHLAHHPLTPENIIFTENIGNLKLIDVGFDQRKCLSYGDTSQDIYNYGMVIKEVLDTTGIDNPRLRRVAERCTDANPDRRPRDTQSLRMALAGRRPNTFYIAVAAFLAGMVALMVYLSLTDHPRYNSQKTAEPQAIEQSK